MLLPLTVLLPGRIIIDVDGLSLADPNTAIAEAIAIIIAKAEDPRTKIEFPQYLAEVTVLGDFY